MNVEDVKKKAQEVNGKVEAKIGKKGKRIVLALIVAIIIFSIVLALILNHKEYSVLYSGVTAEEAAEIVTLLQEQGVDYQYKDSGDVLVDKKQEDAVRAKLAMNGYPKNAFAYSTFINNAKGMTTDSDKQTFKVYELQDRIGGTISLFEGVKDAKVNIALGETRKYVLQDSSMLNDPSASVTVVMEEGETLSAEQVAAAQRLVATSIAGMEMENVAIIDSNTGLDLSALYIEAEQSNADSSEIARMVENEVAFKVVNILEPIYGTGNVRVSVKCKINMEELVRETLTYYTPEKIDENDKTGIIQKEEVSEEMSEGVTGDGGVVGTETNSDITQYAGSGYNGNTSFSSMSASREFAINHVKEQGQVPAGAVEDLTVSVIVNGKDFGDLTAEEVRSLTANAAGIYANEAENKITVASASFYNSVPEPVVDTDLEFVRVLLSNPLYWIVAAAIFLFLLLLLILFIVLRRRRKKKKKLQEEAEAAAAEVPVITVEAEKNPEIMKLQNEKTQDLRDKVRDFTEQNPEISAQLLKDWLNGGGRHGE